MVENMESEEELRLFAESVPPIPTTEKEIRFVEELTKVAVLTAMDRHAGHLRITQAYLHHFSEYGRSDPFADGRTHLCRIICQKDVYMTLKRS